jgi:hypothetical protein
MTCRLAQYILPSQPGGESEKSKSNSLPNNMPLHLTAPRGAIVDARVPQVRGNG